MSVITSSRGSDMYIYIYMYKLIHCHTLSYTVIHCHTCHACHTCVYKYVTNMYVRVYIYIHVSRLLPLMYTMARALNVDAASTSCRSSMRLDACFCFQWPLTPRKSTWTGGSPAQRYFIVSSSMVGPVIFMV